MADEKKNVAPQDAPPHTGPTVTDKDKAVPGKTEASAPGADKAVPSKAEPSPAEKGKTFGHRARRKGRQGYAHPGEESAAGGTDAQTPGPPSPDGQSVQR